MLVLSTVALAAVVAANPMPWGQPKPSSTPVATVEASSGTYTYDGLAGFGYLPYGGVDSKGDTIGGFGSSATIDKKSWKQTKKGVYTGTLWGLPDRGFNVDGTINFQPRGEICGDVWGETWEFLKNLLGETLAEEVGNAKRLTTCDSPQVPSHAGHNHHWRKQDERPAQIPELGLLHRPERNAIHRTRRRRQRAVSFILRLPRDPGRNLQGRRLRQQRHGRPPRDP
jgi:hypothetical protein